MEIRPLTPATWPAFEAWWGGDETTSTCRWCWCMYFRARGRDWSNSTAAQNRDELRALTDGPRPPGLVAYAEGQAVGWVSMGPRSDYERLTYSKVLAPVDDKPVWSIVCFVVGRRSRRQGVAGTLLKAAIDYARDHGAAVLEAYPADIPAGTRVLSANVYQGTLSMFERAGFKVVARRQYNEATPVRPIVRLDL